MSKDEDLQKSLKQFADMLKSATGEESPAENADMSKNMQNLLNSVLGAKPVEGDIKHNVSQEEWERQYNLLKNFCVAAPAFKIGDMVGVTSEYGTRYKLASNVPIVICDVFAEPKVDDDGDVIHGCIAIMTKDHKSVVTHAVDFRYLKKVDKK